ncbi:MAG TPA: monovalent cation/H(+) antiporter subunit G [Thermoanaerobaculia bacterium]|nr:monovalent cation/H(+) antiporter subunit G [Thermoanaerobaculia bacterium]
MSYLIAFFLLLGSTFLLLAALGVLRMPDLYMRMSSSSKGVSLGVGLLSIGLALHMDDPGVTTRAILLMLLFFLKAPVAAHVLGRAAYMSGVPLSDKTFLDEMGGEEHVDPPPSTAEERASGGL